MGGWLGETELTGLAKGLDMGKGAISVNPWFRTWWHSDWLTGAVRELQISLTDMISLKHGNKRH